MTVTFTTQACLDVFHGNPNANWVDFPFLCFFALRKVGNEISVTIATIPLPVLSTTHPYQTLKERPSDPPPTWPTHELCLEAVSLKEFSAGHSIIDEVSVYVLEGGNGFSS